MASSAPHLVEIGFVARAHGVRGQLRIVLHDASSNPLSSDLRLQVGDRGFRIIDVREVSGALLVSLDGIDDRDRAACLKGLPVSVERSVLGLEEDEILLADLVGARVIDATGAEWGRVETIQQGPQDLLVVVDGDIERLVPIVDELIVDIDLAGGVIAIDVPDDWPSTKRSS